MENKELTNQEPEEDMQNQAKNPVSEETQENVEAQADVTSEKESTEETETIETPIEEPKGPVEESAKADSITGNQLVEDSDDEDSEEDDSSEEEDDEDFESKTREELVERLQELIEEGDILKIKTKVALIKVAFIGKTKKEHQEHYLKYLEEGGEKESYQKEDDPLEEKFRATFELYKEKKLSYQADQEKIKQDNLSKKKDILEKLRDLISSDETLKATYDNFKELQDQWKTIGMVPKAEVSDLWANYHFLVEKFFDKVKISKELKDLDLKKNLENKVELCEKAEELLLENSITKSFKALQQYHQEWKDIGPVPQDKKDEVWDRFKAATDKINQRRREHYEKLHNELQSNFEAKQALCEKAEEVVAQKLESIKQWQKATDEVNELLKIWKTIGPAPRKVNDEVWERFKTYLDTFFSGKKDFFGKIKEQQVDNYNLKLDLVNQAEALKDSIDWKATTSALIKLQEEWKKIGPVPRKHSDKIWKRFRAACDDFFSAKDQHFKSQRDNEKENLQAKKALIEEIKTFDYSDDKIANLKVLKDFQRKWMDIGYVPFNEKESVSTEYRKAIDEQMNKLNISSIEMNSMDFKEKIDKIKENPGAGRVLQKEITFLNNKISKMQEDINLWENNIGFLANSKNANILKAEFEKKINAAKKEMNLMVARLRYLRKEASNN